MDRFADDGKLGQRFTLADDLSVSSSSPRPTFTSADDLSVSSS